MKRMVIITGASGGIGSQILNHIVLEKDIRCCCLLRRIPDHLHGPQIAYVKADFAQSDSAYISEVEQWMDSNSDCGELILLLLAAVIKPIEAIGKLGEGLQENIFTNVLSQVRLTDSVTKKARELNLPVRIVQFDSGAAYKPIPGWSLYCASKAYMSMFLKVLEKEQEDYRIVLFDPGVVDTNMQNDIRDAASDAFVDKKVFDEYKRTGNLNESEAVANYVMQRYVLKWNAESVNEKYIR